MAKSAHIYIPMVFVRLVRVNINLSRTISFVFDRLGANKIHNYSQLVISLYTVISFFNLDQVHKFPHVEKFMHLTRIKIFPLYNIFFGSLPVYTPLYIYIPGLPLQCTLPFLSMPCELRFEPATIKLKQNLRINLITNWGKFCSCCCLGENFALVPSIF